MTPSFDEVWQVLQRDVDACVEADSPEFPLSIMCRSLAHRIWNLGPPDSPDLRALDVGTGSGAHAFIMAARGYRPVTGIDVSAEAVEAAGERLHRLSRQAPWQGSRIDFAACGLDDISSHQQGPFHQTHLITFNPPGFYNLLRAEESSPAARGVYTDGGGDPARHPLLCRFFEKVVMPLSPIGGRILCTWPGMERRVVETDPQGRRPGLPQHPAVLLKHWFGVEVDGCEEDVDFYDSVSPIGGDYGLGPSFHDNLRLADRKGLYSRLFRMQDANFQGQPSFRFGILGLERIGKARLRIMKGIDGVAP